MERKEYVNPEMLLLKFKSEDIICASVGEGTEDIPGQEQEVDPFGNMSPIN